MAAEEVKFVFTMDDQFSDMAKKAESTVSGLESKLNTIGTAVVGAFSVGAIVNFGRAVVDSFGKMEMFKTSLTTMLRGNVNEAEALNNQLIQIAKTTPFELTEVQDATRQLIAFGSQAGNVGDELITLGNVASGIGAPIKDIAYLYGTIRTQGRAMTVDINQFANRGIPIWSELEKITGKTGMALRKFVEDGKVGFPQIQQVMANLTKEGGQFFGLMEAQSKTVTGQISNLGDAWEQLKVSIGESQAGMVKSSLWWVTNITNDLTNYLNRVNFIEKSIANKKGNLRTYQGGSEAYQAEMGALSDMVRNAVTTGSAQGGDPKKQIQFLQNLAEVKNERFLDEIKKIKDPNMLISYYAPQQNNRLALIREGIDQLKGAIDLQNSKTDDKKTSATKSSNEADKKQADKLKTPNYTQITINIDQMTGVETIELDKTESIGQNIGEQILKEMVKAVTDSQIVAGAVK